MNQSKDPADLVELAQPFRAGCALWCIPNPAKDGSRGQHRYWQAKPAPQQEPASGNDGERAMSKQDSLRHGR